MQIIKKERKIKQQIIGQRDVKFLARHKFGIDLTPSQVDIVRRIAFMENRRLSISAMTRYGKTLCVSIGIAILLDLNLPLKIAFIGPKQEQAGLLRQYMADLILKDPSLLGKAQIFVEGEQRIMKEASRKRMTFTTGAEYRVFSAEGDADRLMGFGADIVIKDEACLIGRTAHAKIMRMLGDSPDESILIELYNPWDRDNVAYEHTLDSKFHKIQIGWEVAVKEGRTTTTFIDEQRQELTPLEFTVLYDSRFPDQSEDSLFNFKDIEFAKDKEMKFTREEEKIIGCDVGDKGLDKTVIIWGRRCGNAYFVDGIYSEDVSDPMTVAAKIRQINSEYHAKTINVDCIGVGSGVVARLREIYENEKVRINACHYGEAVDMNKWKKKDPTVEKKRFINKKAFQYFRLREIFENQAISIPAHKQLATELIKMKFEFTSSGKVRILDPEDKSPDFADALVYFCWQDPDEGVIMFIGGDGKS